jgi:integrase
MALKKKAAVKRQAWNKGVEVGKREAFTPAQVKRIRGVLADRGVSGLRDLALFSVAIDTMLQGPELLALTVKDVQLPNGTIRSVIQVARTRRKPPVRCALSERRAPRRSLLPYQTTVPRLERSRPRWTPSRPPNRRARVSWRHSPGIGRRHSRQLRRPSRRRRSLGRRSGEWSAGLNPNRAGN